MANLADIYNGTCMSEESTNLFLLIHQFCFKTNSVERANAIQQKLVEVINKLHLSISDSDPEIIIWLKKAFVNLILIKKKYIVHRFNQLYDANENFNTIPEINNFLTSAYHPNRTREELYELLQTDPANFFKTAFLNDETFTRIQLHEINILLQSYLDIHKLFLFLIYYLRKKLTEKHEKNIKRWAEFGLKLQRLGRPK